MSYRVLEGDCVELMAAMPAGSVDAVVCDPPYGLEFMGREWDKLDAGLPQENVWKGRRGQGGSSIGTDDSKPSSRHHVALGAGKKHAFKRCDVCGKRQFSGSPCECPEPEWSIEYPEGAPSSSIRMQRWHQAWATEALRVLKPGGHLLAFGGTRTYHRLVCAVEDAGFEIRDTISWLYGSGFPKSLDVGKAIDKRGGNAHLAAEIAQAIKSARETRGWTTAQADRHFCGGTTNWTWYEGRKGFCRPPTPNDFDRIVAEWPELASLAETVAEVERERVGTKQAGMGSGETFGMLQAEGRNGEADRVVPITAPATPEAERWEGYGTALKPAHEPVVVARKPLSGTVAGNVLEHGVGALNIDGTRVGPAPEYEHKYPNGAGGTRRHDVGLEPGGRTDPVDSPAGRWPANVVLDGEAARLLDEQTGELHAPVSNGSAGAPGATWAKSQDKHQTYADTGGASRFFYVAKASRAERNAGLEGFEEQLRRTMDGGALVSEGRSEERGNSAGRNVHPTVKPISLMRWLVRLVTPPNGTVLDPFVGSGTTGCAAVLEGFDFIGLEREPEYVKIAEARIAWWHKHCGDGEAADILAAGELRDSVEATGQLGMFD